MKNTTLIILSLLCSFSFGQVWQQKSNFSGNNRLAGEAFSVNRKGYIAFGLNPSTGIRDNEIYEYDVVLDSWTAKSPAPFLGRSGGVVFSYDTCAILGLGWNSSNTFDDMYRYFPTTETWDTLAPYPGNGGRNTLYARIGTKIYIGGGNQGTNFPYNRDFWEYDISLDNWTAKGNLPFGNRIGGVSFTIDSMVYMGLGHDGSSDFNDLWAYNTLTNSWTQVANFPADGRLGASFFVLNNKAIVGGGHRFGSNNQGTRNDYYEYDPTTNSWTIISNNFTDSNRTFSSSFVINNTAYIYGGASNYPAMLNDVWTYRNQSVSVTEIDQSNVVENELIVYPNPNKGEFFIASKNEVIDGQLRIFNQNGMLVFEKNYHQISSPIKIEIRELENAPYYYKLIKIDGQSSSGTILKVD